MAKFTDSLDTKLCDFIKQQKMFFTATAAAEGRVNLSPKGLDSFRILDKRTVAYLDLTGSGNETAAHIECNQRITVMFCSFDEKPLILRLYGEGHVIHFRDDDWPVMMAHFEPIAGVRQIIKINISSVQTSCGYAVPQYNFVDDRDILRRWAEKKGAEGVQQYWQDKNQHSIDGLPTHLLQE
ncbi:MAG: pyridoxamine 5'-phosphate oxidase family protein [Gammaproteobacteria bacterium]|nr:pyridoxamine 5'-phosphate oxidase family protein [Gammaproteobacteria bacterium]